MPTAGACKGAKGMRAEKPQRFSALKLPLQHALTFARLLTYVNARIEVGAELYSQVSTNQGNMKYSVLILYQATPLWLSLTRDERGVFFEKKVVPLIQKFHQSLSIRLFDSEAFHASISDFILVECDDLKDYYFFMEYLRDTELFGKPYIVLKDVVLGVENGFQFFEGENR